MAKGIQPKTDRDWEIDSAADTLMKAEEIKRQKPLYKAALKELRKRQSELAAALKKNGAAKALMNK